MKLYLTQSKARISCQYTVQDRSLLSVAMLCHIKQMKNFIHCTMSETRDKVKTKS